MNIFLNYADESDAIAQLFTVALEAAGFQVSSHVGGIAGGENWNREVETTVQACDWFVTLLSPGYGQSYPANYELAIAIRANKPILPVVVQPIEPTSAMLQDTFYMDISVDPQSGIKKVIDWLKERQSEQRIEEKVVPAIQNLTRDIEIILNTPSPDRIFIAYFRKQRPLAQTVYELLSKNGKAVFWDAKIKAGATWRQTIQKALDDATHLVVIWTPEAAESDEVEREVSYALAERKVIVPILSKEIPKLPYHLHGLHYIVLDADLSRIETDLLKAIAQFSDDEDIWQ